MATRSTSTLSLPRAKSSARLNSLPLSRQTSEDASRSPASRTSPLLNPNPPLSPSDPNPPGLRAPLESIEFARESWRDLPAAAGPAGLAAQPRVRVQSKYSTDP